MASPALIDIESLLNPISEDSPCGPPPDEDMSPTSIYQAIKSERESARAAERRSIHDGDSLEADGHWQRITELVPEFLQNNSKDLDVCGWYAEAQLRRNGFAGLRDAFKLIQGIINTFWDSLHPMPDEFGIETRVSCLSGLNGEGAEGVLIAPIRKARLTDSFDPGPFSLWQYKQAIDFKNTSDDQARAAKIEAAGFSIDDIERSVQETDANFFVNLRDDINECISVYKAVGAKLDELCGIHDAPPVKTIIEVLEDCLSAINHLAKDKFPIDAAEEETESDAGAEGAAEGGQANVVQKTVRGPIASRDDAFKQLIEIADFFKKTEPHSPVSYVLQKAVKWGNMPLGELISELITDEQSRERFSELTGVSCNDEN